MGCGHFGDDMNTKYISAISLAAALAIITPAYAGGLGGGLGMNRGLSGHGALQGQGAASGSLDKPKLHPATNAVKPGSVTGDAAAQTAASVSKTGSTESTAAASKVATSNATATATNSAANTAAGTAAQAQASKPNTSSSVATSASTIQKPAPSANLSGAGGLNAATNNGALTTNGVGSVDAQHSSSATSLEVAGTASATASRNPQ
jgi:trimeric autotransporter adhesin